MTRRGQEIDPRGTDALTPGELERARSAADELERYAETSDITPRSDLGARILAALEAEPTPAPLTALSEATRRRRGAAMLAALRDLWGVAGTGGRPVGIRLSAAVAVGLLLVSIGSAGGMAAVGAWNALHPAVATPTPTATQQPVVVPPVPTPSASAAPTPSPTATPVPSAMPAPSMVTMPPPSVMPMPTPYPTMVPSATPMMTHHPESTATPMGTHHP